MFDQVLGESERAELMRWIHEWESAHPGIDAAHRLTGWIDVAYAFESRRGRNGELRNAVHIGPVITPIWRPEPSFP